MTVDDEKLYHQIKSYVCFQEYIFVKDIVAIFDISTEHAKRHFERLYHEGVLMALDVNGEMNTERGRGDYGIVIEPQTMHNTPTPQHYSYEIGLEPLVPPMGEYQYVAKITSFYRKRREGEGEELLANPVGEAWGRTEEEAREKIWKKIEMWIREQEY